MPKWLSAAFALFLSLQVFGARGRAVDKILSGYLFSFQQGAQVAAPKPGSALNVHLISNLPLNYPQPNLWCIPVRDEEAWMNVKVKAAVSTRVR